MLLILDIKRIVEGVVPKIVTVQSPLHYSNVALVDPVTKKAVRVAKRFLEDGTKVQTLPKAPNIQILQTLPDNSERLSCLHGEAGT